MHAPQATVASKPVGQTLQSAPWYAFWHVQLQPVRMLPTTAVACPEQFAAIVHDRTQFGPSYPAAHTEQPDAAEKPVGHTSHFAPV